MMEKVAIITGGTKGIGLGIAKVFVREGFKVALIYRSDKAQAEKAVALLGEDKTLAIAADITQVSALEPGQQVLEGIEVVEAYGHTPGHVGFELCSKGEKLPLWADIVHNVAVQLRYPEWCIAFDTDGKAGAMSRQKMLRRVVDEHLLIGGGHLPYLALGYIKQQDERLVWGPLS